MRLLLVAALAALSSPAVAAVPKVLTDFAPIQSLVMQVMGDLGTPVMLSPVGGDPHDFQMRPSLATALSEADIVFWDGPELMPSLDGAIRAMAGKAQSVPLLHEGGGHIRQFDDGEGTDPHAWLDPTNAEAWVVTIAARLSALDPDRAATYAANAAAAQLRLKALDADLTAELAPARGVPIVEFHDAFGYFADHFGLNIVGTIELGDAASPSAARLVEIRKTLAKAKATCVFPELGRDPKFIATVTEGTGARIGAGQDPEGTDPADAPSPQLYDTMLRALARTVADCVKG
ncbi:MAG: zinc ABC transporter substrate-binding protein [Rhodobacteraceae bacterium]|nr:zinc ABC transporter substrate-binding protein [Paracoccaceae bacterium]